MGMEAVQDQAVDFIVFNPLLVGIFLSAAWPGGAVVISRS